MLALDVLNDAIEEKRKVSFIYNRYGTDFKLHPRRNEPYIVNPYQMVANNGRYYLTVYEISAISHNEKLLLAETIFSPLS